MEQDVNVSEVIEGLELIEATLLNNIAGGSMFDQIGPPWHCGDNT